MSLHHPVSKSSERVAKCIGRLLYYHRDVLQHTATHCNTPQHTATHCTTIGMSCNTLYHTVPHCNTLQHTATHCTTIGMSCNTLYHTVPHCNTMQHTAAHCTTIGMSCNKLYHTATHCKTLQHTATHCNIDRLLYYHPDIPVAAHTHKEYCHNVFGAWISDQWSWKKTSNWQKRRLFESLFEKKDVWLTKEMSLWESLWEKRRLTDKRDVSLRVSLRKKTSKWQKRCLFESLFEKRDVWLTHSTCAALSQLIFFEVLTKGFQKNSVRHDNTMTMW